MNTLTTKQHLYFKYQLTPKISLLQVQIHLHDITITCVPNSELDASL